MASGTAVIAVEGVLRAPVGGQPVRDGVTLYRALSAVYNIILVADNWWSDIEDWLLQENLTSHSKVWLTDFTIENTGIRNVERIARKGSDIRFVVTADPEFAHQCFINGFNTLLFTERQYAYPEWMPDFEREISPWDTLQKQVADTAKKRAEDQRMERLRDKAAAE